MRMRLSVIDEDGSTDAVIGFFSKSDMANIIECAEKNKLFCLQFVSLIDNTYFNHRQQYLMKNDLNFLKQKGNLSLNVLNMIEHGLEVATKDSSFTQLKFEPIEA